jgi:hypothetical protein
MTKPDELRDALDKVAISFAERLSKKEKVDAHEVDTFKALSVYCIGRIRTAGKDKDPDDGPNFDDFQAALEQESEQ